MKYWKESEAEHLLYNEGGRVAPYKYPASIVTHNGLTVGEYEIIPNTTEVKKVIDPATFEDYTTLCVKMEYRKWREDGREFTIQSWVPLKSLGYDKEPYSSIAFDEAMKIV